MKLSILSIQSKQSCFYFLQTFFILVIDDMNYDLAYLCDVHPDDINSIQLDSFIMGTNENSKNIHVSHDVTLEERENLRKKKEKEK